MSEDKIKKVLVKSPPRPSYKTNFLNPRAASLFTSNPTTAFAYYVSEFYDITKDYLMKKTDPFSGDYDAICLSGYDTNNASGVSLNPIDAQSMFQGVGGVKIKVRIFGVHDRTIPWPLYEEEQAGADSSVAYDYIDIHSWAYPENPADMSPMGFGTQLKCFRRNGIWYYKNANSNLMSLLAGGQINFLDPSLWNSPGLIGDRKPSKFGGQHAIEKLEARAIVSDKPVIGIGAPQAASQALVELNFWKGKVEQHVSLGNSVENMRIKLYKMYVKDGITDPSDPKVAIAYIGGSSTGGTGGASTGVMHWSATSISWVMRGTDFPKYYGHSYYSTAVAKGKAPGWEIHSTTKSKIVVQVGDVFVRTGAHGRGDTTHTASHGDMVYKITSQGAHLCGGNLGAPGTFKEAGILPLGPSKELLSSGQYLIVLKKMK